MAMLILGLAIFLGAHSLRMYAEGWRTRMLARLGARGWKALYSVVSIVGFVLIVWGFGEARQQPVPLYAPPAWARHVNALFTLAALVLFFAARGPANHFRAKLGHPMLAGTALWALGHLLTNGSLHDVLLFGAFLLWAAGDYAMWRRRDRIAGTTYPAGTLAGDLGALVIGTAAWAAFAFWLHARWIGVSPFG